MIDSRDTMNMLLPSIDTLPLTDMEINFFANLEARARKEIMKYQNDIAYHEPAEAEPVKGSWKPEEDELLKDAVTSMSPVLWDLVSEKVPGRSAIQCKERWLYRLNPDVKKTRFEKWEDQLIIREHKRIGNHWTLIANKLPGRTSCAVKNRWYSALRTRYNDEINESIQPDDKKPANTFKFPQIAETA